MALLERVSSSDISVVIQGPSLHNEGNGSQLEACVDSIRRVLPQAEIILSTWKGQSYAPDIVDRVVFSEDPGSTENWLGQPWNFNRMVISTRNGLEKASRPYTLKFRADLRLSSAEIFVRPQSIERDVDARFKIFRHPVVMTNIFARNPASCSPLLFHPSDIVQFGLTEDLADLWNRRIFNRSEVCSGLSLGRCLGFLGYTGLRMVPEQALMTEWLNSNGYEVRLPYPGFVSKKYCELSERLLSTNFFIVDWKMSGVEFPRRFLLDRKLEKTIYDADHGNSLAGIYSSEESRDERIRVIFWNAYFYRFFSLSFWTDLLSTPLALVSPNIFFKVRDMWRNLRWKS